MTTENMMIESLKSFCDSLGIPHMSADEIFHQYNEILTAQDKDYLLSFIEDWEALF